MPSFFSQAELQPVRDGIAAMVDALAQRLFATGRITSTFADLPFSTRLISLEKAWPGAATLIHKDGVLRPELAALWSNPRLLDLIQQILGPDVDGHPVWNIRSKTPDNQFATVPWHQDTAYLAEGAQDTSNPPPGSRWWMPTR